VAGKKKIKRIMVNGAVFFDLILLAFFSFLAIVSPNYNPRARSIPLGLGIVGSLMMIVQLLADTFPDARTFLKFICQDSLAQKGDSPESEEGREETTSAEKMEKGAKVRPAEWVQVTRLALWMAGFIVLLDVTNYLIPVGAFIFLVTKIEGRATWSKSIILALGVTFGFYVLFDLILGGQF